MWVKGCGVGNGVGVGRKVVRIEGCGVGGGVWCWWGWRDVMWVEGWMWVEGCDVGRGVDVGGGV